MSITFNQLTKWIVRAAEQIMKQKNYLTELDQAIGDGDHGINLSRGFQEVVHNIQTLETDDIGQLFHTIGNTLIQKVGGASGPIYGIAFIKGGAILKGKKEITVSEFSQFLHKSVEAIKGIGKSEVGNKTVLDVWTPLADYLQEKGENIDWQEAISYCWEQAEKTKSMKAVKGRAAYLGERSIGHLDPGAVSSSFLFEALFETLGEGNEAK
ncbi:dihydroxyacetone kinase subunit DhaL [Paenibacillus sediminis]|uniref:Dihydroxyacetone kinase-like protein n=1 Tax=Paenibacillus sediminis TaxID=664909 RepID=A0ABS4H111_9BACL|nr:dihydroxyacetone kinase subunit DhaL [Paenibacillus sediminis]MBP1936057.1 dihydroxyacetone kinase-like protein [Paenibacillus sediminis]